MDELASIFRNSDLARVVDRLVARYRQGKPLKSGVVVLKNPKPGERSALDDLLGRPSSAGMNFRLPLEKLPGTEEEIFSVLEILRGPLVNRREERENATQAWARLRDDWTAFSWPEELWSFVKRIPGDPGCLLQQAAEILARDPERTVHLAKLAAETTGDSHALDRNSPLAGICLRALGYSAALDARTRREAWAELGVLIDDLSAPLLCLNLRTSAGTEWINWHADRGEPFFLPWRQMSRVRPCEEMKEVFVCENPAIVSEAANGLGVNCRPLICLNGMPASTARTMLDLLVASGVAIRLRADFDWAGLRIIDQIYEEGRTTLWRMDVPNYRSGKQGSKLTGLPFHPQWGAELSREMQKRGMAVYEEELTDRLLEDLRKEGSLPQHSGFEQ